MKRKYLIVLALSLVASCGKNSLLNLRKANPSSASNADSWNSQFNLAFKNDLYPLLTQNCGGCHAQSTAPFFASSNPDESAKAILDGNKIDFTKASLSRLVARMKQDRHNCGAPEKCDEIGEAISAKIEALLTKIPKKPGTELKNVSPELTFKNLVATDKHVISSPGFIVIEKESYGMPIKFEDSLSFVSFPATPTTVSYQAKIEAVSSLYIWARYRRADVGQLSAQFSYDDNQNRPQAITLTFGVKNTANKFEWVLLNTLTAGTANAFSNAKPQNLSLNVVGSSLDLDMLVVTDVDFLKTELKTPQIAREVLQFDLSTLGVPQGRIEIAVSVYDPTGSQSYLFEAPKYVGPGKVKIKGLKVLVNGKWNPVHSLFNVLDLVVGENEYLTERAMTVGKELGKDGDKFSLSFEEISKVE